VALRIFCAQKLTMAAAVACLGRDNQSDFAQRSGTAVRFLRLRHESPARWHRFRAILDNHHLPAIGLEAVLDTPVKTLSVLPSIEIWFLS
jgi:hypothetical protein